MNALVAERKAKADNGLLYNSFRLNLLPPFAEYVEKQQQYKMSWFKQQKKKRLDFN